MLAALHSIVLVANNPPSGSWFVLAILTLLSGSFTVRIPTIPARLSVSETFVFAAVLMFGPASATVIVVLDTLVISFWLGRRSNPASRLLFNVSAPALAIWISAEAFYLVSGIQPLSEAYTPTGSLVFPLLGLAVLYFLLNSWLIAFAVSFQTQRSAAEIWRRNLLWLSINYFSGASVAALLLPYLLQTESALLRIVGILLPLLVIFYLTLKTALGRVEDANKHLDELNRLYLSTIETLAMAIDAKDQITHGHIRRVQKYAVNLARHLGVKDNAQIQAIEAASLLHDMGKLAIPEYILNKPGRLTPVEFDTMKAHASIGADILSAIAFPYPVVPIVRHHHENWNGHGYPDGLSGAAIPIGARILAVVDCFDALTSDRPYRPRLPDAEAIDILAERRGTMYDPLVVDAFIEIHRDLVKLTCEVDGSANDRNPFVATMRIGDELPGAGPSHLGSISASTEETLTLYSFAQAISRSRSIDDVMQHIAAHVRRMVPVSTLAFFRYEPSSDHLHVSKAIGESAQQILGLSIKRGERLSGWVAANLRTIVNSDPILDFGESGRAMKTRLCSCLSTPLLAEDRLVGVLSLYSSQRDVFTDDHRRAIEALARGAAQVLARLLATELLPYGPDSVGLSKRQLRSLISERLARGSNDAMGMLAVVYPVERSTATTSEKLDSLRERLSNALPADDLCFVYSTSEVCVLRTDDRTLGAEAFRSELYSILDRAAAAGDLLMDCSIAVAVSVQSKSGATLDDLVRSVRHNARARSDGDTSGASPSVH
ncbi:MAG: HD domain-containing phosphohydrolase [Vicinamibacterales bacterium]